MKELCALGLLSVYTILEFVAYMPQIIQLFKTKSADDLSLCSWFTWIVSDLCYLLYVLLESPEIGVVFIASLNLFFVIFVYVLTAYYQYKNKKLKKKTKHYRSK